VEATCCAPEASTCCQDTCCKPKKKCFLKKLFSCLKKDKCHSSCSDSCGCAH
jgi:hypothetical protein